MIHEPIVGDQGTRQFIGALGIPAYTTDATGAITSHNDAAVDLWGRPPEATDAWAAWDQLYTVAGDGTTPDHTPMAKAIMEGRVVHGDPLLGRRRDGTFVEAQAFSTPLVDADRTVVGGVHVLVDTTERRRALEQRAQSADALARSDAAREEFLGMVSHELRTPVTTISGNAELLRDRGDHLTGDQRDTMISDIAADAERLRILVENLLTLSRVEAGMRPDMEPLVLDRVVEAEIIAFRRGHPQTPVRYASGGEPLIVEGDRAFLMIVLQNLLSNGQKYGAPDGIDIEVSRHGDEAWIRALDRGIGLDGLDPTDVFRPFYRAPAAEARAGGAGIGLAVSDRLVNVLDGRMWAKPRVDGGTEVGFSLPLTTIALDPAV